MESRKWTPEQQVAIDQRNDNILVSAAAGSGKTAVLTERVLRCILEDNIEIDRLLIVTFTKAAAQEMKERITLKLSDELDKLYQNKKENKPRIEYLRRQMALLAKASISTIHSFCLKIIKAYFNELDIDPNIRVGEEAECSVIKNEALDEVLDEYFEIAHPEFLKLAQIFSEANDTIDLKQFKEIILDLYTFSKSTPFPKEWLEEQIEKLKKPCQDISELPWAEQLQKQLQEMIESYLVIYEKAITISKKSNGPDKYEALFINEYQQIKEVQNCENLENMLTAIKNIDVTKRLPSQGKECDPALANQAKAYRDLIKEELKKLREEIVPYLQDKTLLEQLPKIGALMETLVEVVLQFEKKYIEAKKEANICDFNDVEHYCLQLLIDKDEDGHIVYTDVAKELGQFYEEVYIDEYQDSNGVQEMLLKAISEADKKSASRFLVGDIKQSIYRFRLANPLIFLDKYQTWSKYHENSNAQSIAIDLSQNFRSRANILEAVNDIFEQIMSPEVGELDYDEAVKLRAGRSEESGDAVELYILETDTKEASDSEDLEELKATEQEAKMVAGLIHNLLNGQKIYDKDLKEYRNLQPEDIVILLRATTNKAEIYESALENMGIGAYSDYQDNFFDTIEIKTMLSLLKIIDNPLQDIPLLTVLRSPIVGIDYDELVMIRNCLPEGHFYEALKKYVETLEVTHRLSQFVSQLENYRSESSTLKVYDLLSKLYIETGYYNAVSMLPSGENKKANLDLLKQHAMQYQQGHLFGFLYELDKKEATKDGMKVAKLIVNQEHLVRIMSVHKSKGLEFNVVFLCDTGKSINKMDLNKKVLMHHQFGLTPSYYVDTEKFIQYPSLPKFAIREQLKIETISEEMRILYVALTRAKEKLIITGTVKERTEKIKKWRSFSDRQEKKIMPFAIKKYSTYLDWIGMSLYAHEQVDTIRNGEHVDYLFKGKSKWNVHFYTKQDLETTEEKKQSESKKDLLKNWDSTKQYTLYKEEIERRFNFVYPYQQAVSLPTKVSVTEISNRARPLEEGAVQLIKETEIEAPDFIKDRTTPTGASKGTLLHSIFEHWDYLKYTQEDEIRQELERLVFERKLDANALKVANIKRLAQMSQSEVINKMRHADCVEKEKSFIYLAPATLIDSSYPEDERILIQGIIDAYFIDKEGITLIDYKTDYINTKDWENEIIRIKNRYEKQIKLYALALEKLLKIPVVNQYIYLYNVNRFERYK